MKTLTQYNTSQVCPQGTEACEQDYKLTLIPLPPQWLWKSYLLQGNLVHAPFFVKDLH